jgi:hypothetical protein
MPEYGKVLENITQLNPLCHFLAPVTDYELTGEEAGESL